MEVIVLATVRMAELATYNIPTFNKSSGDHTTIAT